MATTPTSSSPDTATGPYVPRLTDEELARRNKGLIDLLNSWEEEDDEEEQRETLAALRKALGPGRIASSRALFP